MIAIRVENHALVAACAKAPLVRLDHADCARSTLGGVDKVARSVGHRSRARLALLALHAARSSGEKCADRCRAFKEQRYISDGSFLGE
eukprot:scaffold30664_cov72-Phaeocystis_antarctica.AAC.3